jgi:hypothetical protein
LVLTLSAKIFAPFDRNTVQNADYLDFDPCLVGHLLGSLHDPNRCGSNATVRATSMAKNDRRVGTQRRMAIFAHIGHRAQNQPDYSRCATTFRLVGLRRFFATNRLKI